MEILSSGDEYFYLAFIAHDTIRIQQQFFIFQIRSKWIMSCSCYNNCTITKLVNFCWLIQNAASFFLSLFF